MKSKKEMALERIKKAAYEVLTKPGEGLERGDIENMLERKEIDLWSMAEAFIQSMKDLAVFED